jgi:hypothetical protein
VFVYSGEGENRRRVHAGNSAYINTGKGHTGANAEKPQQFRGSNGGNNKKYTLKRFVRNL